MTSVIELSHFSVFVAVQTSLFEQKYEKKKMFKQNYLFNGKERKNMTKHIPTRWGGSFLDFRQVFQKTASGDKSET
jgi:hypothetical protein